MQSNKNMGLLILIIGLIFILFPMFSGGLVSIIVGLSLLFLGISAVYTGLDMRQYANNTYSGLFLVVGLIVTVLGFMFIFYIDALSFVVSILFYLIGFILIVFGIIGLLSMESALSFLTSLLVLIMGIVTIGLGVFAMAQPMYIAIIIGIILVIEGILLIVSD